MARRKNTSVFEDIFGLATLLPWWAGIALAAVAYGFLHHYAVAEIPVQGQPGQIGQMVVGQMTKAFATYGQYIVPLILLAGAAASFLRRRKRERLVQNVAADRSSAALRGMNWRDFELLVGEAFRVRGYAVEETGGSGADGGVDLRLRKGNEVFLAQCKQWRAYKVSVTVVRELLGAMAAEGATGGYVVTSGIFTIDAQKFAKGRNIRLIDGLTLAAWIEEARAGGLVKQPEALWEQRRQAKAPEAPATQSPDLACPRCGGSMVRRIAKQGANAGNSFWGCATFPKCRGVRGL